MKTINQSINIFNILECIKKVGQTLIAVIEDPFNIKKKI